MNEVETKNGTGGLGVALAFIGGALVGTVATLLLAPRSGPETVKRITEAAERSRHRVERMALATREAGQAARTAFASALQEPKS